MSRSRVLTSRSGTASHPRIGPGVGAGSLPKSIPAQDVANVGHRLSTVERCRPVRSPITPRQTTRCRSAVYLPAACSGLARCSPQNHAHFGAPMVSVGEFAPPSARPDRTAVASQIQNLHRAVFADLDVGRFGSRCTTVHGLLRERLRSAPQSQCFQRKRTSNDAVGQRGPFQPAHDNGRGLQTVNRRDVSDSARPGHGLALEAGPGGRDAAPALRVEL